MSQEFEKPLEQRIEERRRRINNKAPSKLWKMIFKWRDGPDFKRYKDLNKRRKRIFKYHIRLMKKGK